MKHLLLSLAALAAATPAAAQVVDAGKGDWSGMPVAAQRGEVFMGPAVLDQIKELARRGTCTMPGLAASRIDLNYPVALQFGATGQVERIVVRDVGCPQLETLVGIGVRAMASRGEFLPSRGAGWHRSAISFEVR